MSDLYEQLKKMYQFPVPSNGSGAAAAIAASGLAAIEAAKRAIAQKQSQAAFEKSAREALVNLLIERAEETVMLQWMDGHIHSLAMNLRKRLPQEMSLYYTILLLFVQHNRKKAKDLGDSLRGMNADPGAVQLLVDTLKSLRTKLDADAARFDKELGKTVKPQRALSVREAIQINEMAVLLTRLRWLRAELAKNHDWPTFYQKVAKDLAEMSRESALRVKRLTQIYGASGNRESITEYYITLLTEMTTHPKKL